MALTLGPAPSRSPRLATAEPSSSSFTIVALKLPDVLLIFWKDWTVPCCVQAAAARISWAGITNRRQVHSFERVRRMEFLCRHWGSRGSILLDENHKLDSANVRSESLIFM